jgi:cardiolipin synthase
LVAAAIIVLVKLGRADALIALIIIGREITISALREWMASIGAQSSVAVSMIGKLKTVAQMVAILLLLFNEPLLGLNTRQLGTWLIWLAAVLTLWSMAYYLRRAVPELLRHGR